MKRKIVRSKRRLLQKSAVQYLYLPMFALIATILFYPLQAIGSGKLVFEWLGGDCWDIYRGSQFVDYNCGKDQQELQAGIYTIKPKHHPYFTPFTVTIRDGQTSTVSFGGVFVYNWAGGDCWDIYRGSQFVDYDCGKGKQALEAGIYTIKPKHHPYFTPFTVTIRDGYENTVTKGGVLEFNWAGRDCWDIYRGDQFIDYDCGKGKQALEPGCYTIKPKHDPVFSPFNVTIIEGQTTTVSR
ncbi:MAG: hypothetical protein P9M14_02855 [Candidatus Alcyoniella australis]|nr:hypothetical protein [Candidatus Alcyoniella australis]